MSHHIYHTRGVILESRPFGESNRFYKIFTEELGLVGATAQAVREGKSKLRYTLQDSSFVTIDLVRGKEVWRIVSAGPWLSFGKIKKSETKLKLLAHLLSTLSRLLQGESKDEILFSEIINTAEFIEREEFSPRTTLSFETLVSLRLLVHMGYMNKLGYEQFVAPHAYNNDLLEVFETVRVGALVKINEAWNVSHL